MQAGLDGARPLVAAGRAAVLAINNSWQLCPWADALYAADGTWWRDHYDRLEPGGFAGLKLTQDAGTAVRRADVFLLDLKHVHRLLFERPGEIGSGGNSGFQALNAALQFGARDIALVGFDLALDRGLHWHADHKGTNPSAKSLAEWRDRLDAAAPLLRSIGARVVNCAPHSALTAYPKASLQEFLEEKDG